MSTCFCQLVAGGWTLGGFQYITKVCVCGGGGGLMEAPRPEYIAVTHMGMFLLKGSVNTTQNVLPLSLILHGHTRFSGWVMGEEVWEKQRA